MAYKIHKWKNKFIQNSVKVNLNGELIEVLLQDGRLCCTFDIRCSASSQQSRRAAPKEPQSSQTLLHSTVTTAADIVTTDTSSVSDAIPSETTLG